ncbi:MAG: electron transfer flavoprotein subunit alpha/FixB family protein [Rothia sp. (in: high G+C Gram-positive bacteria)]|uniref:electron transfer flavoprotein subunit alpha/FixB family protein n=1 Tax=Rothia sp. (in: high G+C Gram-positive bacteria) TaxID=1885016 RepID=UPI0026DCB509|nr:electron transfer flavoprotein subunit alpha/FixB family protein [Rothia sp. (in: high G+C Gram-positive bacteria)]MDO4884218.1 electron transfer flavoprotein subunit alpha/FixB family protein [Rothia sp. (in: high G+C Gram-positive bacteria)]
MTTAYRVLVICGTTDFNAEPNGVDRELLTLARLRAGLGQGGTQLGVLTFAQASDGVAQFYAKQGAARVFAPAQSLVDALPAAHVNLAVQAINDFGPDLVLAPHDTDSVELMGRIAVRLANSELGSRSVGVVTGAHDVDESLNIRKNVLAGEYDSTVRVQGLPLVTLRPNSVDTAAAPAAAGEGMLTSYTLPGYDAVRMTEVTEKPRSTRPNLEEASIVVAAGRGIGGDLTPIESLADALGAAIGSTRAVTDAGWLDHSTQIGQTGKSVSPELYVSAGISGALQQKVGMDTSKTIVAINKDADAPVFEIADFGIVGDLFTVIPQAVQEIQRRKEN